ncbi:MAG: hypothetical protein IJI10_11485, partial [Eubacterium sp.]|nr:hypothetical protein [Eubacterium sp.]
MKKCIRRISFLPVSPAALTAFLLAAILALLLLPGTAVSAAAKTIVPKQETAYNIDNGSKSLSWKI